MIKRLVLAIVVILAVAAFLTVREQGADEAFDGAFAPLETVRAQDDGSDPLDGLMTGHSVPSVSQSDYGQLLDRMQDSLDDAVDRSVERSSRY